MGCDEQDVSRGGEESWWHQRQPCPICPPQGSQPSTASPFKQDVFVYGASPGSESPSVAAAATPVIMSRSPTGGRRGAGGVPALPLPLEAPRVPQWWVRMGSVALGWRSARGVRDELPRSRKPCPDGAALERWPRLFISVFPWEFISLPPQRWLLLWLCPLRAGLADMGSSWGNSLSPRTSRDSQII